MTSGPLSYRVFRETGPGSYVILSSLGSNRIFKILNRKWSYDKMLIDWVRSGRTVKYLALGQEVWTSLRSVPTPWPRTKYFPFRTSHSVNKCIILTGNKTAKFTNNTTSSFFVQLYQPSKYSRGWRLFEWNYVHVVWRHLVVREGLRRGQGPVSRSSR